MKVPSRWVIITGSLTAIALLVVVLTFATRTYFIERAVSILLDREIYIENVVDIELGKLFSATLNGVQMDHSDARLQADFLLIEMNLSDWLSSDEINLTRLLVSSAEIQFKPSESDGTAVRRPLIPKEFSFKDVTVSYADEDQDWKAHIVSCVGSSRSDRSLVDLDCNGELNEAPFTVKGHYGLPDETIEGESAEFRY